MISEPELTGGSEEPEPDVISDADREPNRAARAGASVGVGAGAGTGLRDRRLWAWGLGGVLLASAVWAGGLRAYDAHHNGRPDMHGYVLGDSPCAGATLKPLTDALGVTDAQTVSPAAAHLGPALDQIRCTLSATAPIRQGGTASYEAFVTIDLHKRTDPHAEFEDQRGLDSANLAPAESTRPVPDLGDEAYLLTISEQTQELKVRHGGAVFTLTLTGYNTFTVSDDTVNALHGANLPSSDIGQFRPALVEAMRKVMAAQQPRP